MIVVAVITMSLAPLPKQAAHHHRTHPASKSHWRWESIVTTAYAIKRQPTDKRSCEVYHNRTANGYVPRIGIAAVDTSVFPFGTVLNIPGYGYAVAEDTGNPTYVHGRVVDL